MSFAIIRVMYHRPSFLVLPKLLGLLAVVLAGALGVLVMSRSWLGALLFVATSLSIAAIKVRLERRTYARYAFQCTVSCKALGCTELLKTITLDLSHRGFFVQTTTPYSLLTRFAFSLEVVEGEPPIEGHAVVRWINHHTPRGMGVEIVRLDDPERFHRILNQASDREPGAWLKRLFRLSAPH